MAYNKLVSPAVKWVGGKRQLLKKIRPHIPDKITTYYEPFLGGGAVFFDVQPKRAVINDINDELINLYKIITNDVESLIEDLKKHRNEENYFYQIRSLDRDINIYSKLTDVERASRIHYLNKTCYNGLFRVNQAGQFNSPFGRYKNPDIINEITLKSISEYFNQNTVRLLNGDYTQSLKGIRRGGFVYFDPPYDPISNSSNFTGYSSGGFNRDEQIRLKEVCDSLNERSINFLLSNSSTEFIHELYKDYNIETIQANRAINSNPQGRGEVNEVLVRNYE